MNRRRLIVVVLTIVAVVAGWFLLYRHNPEYNVWAPKCPVKLVTGYDCPGCGMQRCLHALLHGRFADALHYNYFLAIAMPYALAVALVRFLPPTERVYRLSLVLTGRVAAYTYITFYCIWWVVRNILGL